VPISKGERPATDADEGHNKFLGLQSEGHRGVLIAVANGGLQAIVLAKTASADKADGVVWGRLYLVEEKDAQQWPRVIHEVTYVPDDPRWQIVIP